MPNELATVSTNELAVIAKQAASSGLFPGIKTEQQAFTLMLICQSEGLHPIQAVKRYHVIQGRPTMRADAIQAEFQRQGGRVVWKRSDDQECTVTLIHPVHAPEPGVSLTWTIERAKKAELLGNPLWHKFPAQMLRARAISEAVRMVMPGIIVGIYTPEEVSDFAANKANPVTLEPEIIEAEFEPTTPPARRPQTTSKPKPRPTPAGPAPEVTLHERPDMTEAERSAWELPTRPAAEVREQKEAFNRAVERHLATWKTIGGEGDDRARRNRLVNSLGTALIESGGIDERLISKPDRYVETGRFVRDGAKLLEVCAMQYAAQPRWCEQQMKTYVQAHAEADAAQPELAGMTDAQARAEFGPGADG